jgi:hypothetical protein
MIIGNAAKTFFFFFALIGWVLGLCVHLTAALGDYDLTGPFPGLWLLHVGAIAVWLPTVLILKDNPELKHLKNNLNPRTFFGQIAKEAPAWLRVIAMAGFFYAIINFMFFMVSQHGTPDIMNGQYVLQNHGKIVRTISLSEYGHYQALQTRAFSGHWIAFYGIACAVLYPFGKREQAVF